MEVYLEHHGVKGQKWGVRRFQNADGTLTTEGKIRYRKDEARDKSESALNRAKKPRADIIDKIDQSLRRPKHKAVAGLKTSGVYDRPDGSKDLNRLKKDAKKDAEDMARAKAYYGDGAGTRRKQIKNRISERMKDPDYKAEYEKHLASQDMSKHQKAANRERKMEDTKKSAAKIGRGIKNLILGVGTTSLAAISLYNAAKMIGADKKIAELGKKALSTVMNKVQSMKKPSVKDYDWHSNSSSYTTPKSSYTVPKSSYTVPDSAYRTNTRDIVEKMDRTKHGTQRPWIDEKGNIHFK